MTRMIEQSVTAHVWLVLLMAVLAVGIRLAIVAWVQHRKRVREIRDATHLNDQHQPRW